MISSTFWIGKKVAVTGGAGFLGRHLVKLLGRGGARVRSLDLHPVPLPDVESHVGDIRDPAFVRQALSGCDVIFHSAGTVATWGKALASMHDIHCVGSRNVMLAAGSARVVHTSSILAVGGSTTATPVHEETPFNLRDAGIHYALAKRDAEVIALQAAEAGRDVVVVNPAYLVGPDDPGSVMGQLCRRFWVGWIPVALPGALNLVDVRDVAHGHLLAAEVGQRGRRYILGAEDHTWSSFFALLAEVAHMRPRWVPRVPLAGLTTMALIAEAFSRLTGREPYPSLAHVRLNRWYFYADSTRARTELSYRPRPLVDSLRDAYRWHLEHQLRAPRGIRRWWMRPATGCQPCSASVVDESLPRRSA